MSETFTYLFQYLDREQINIDKDEFQFQIQSHPDYPSLVSIIDTLNFFDIDNGVISVGAAEIELLPDYFVAMLGKENEQPELYFVEKKGDLYNFTQNRKKTVVSRLELELRWKDIVLLVEKSEIENPKQIDKRKRLLGLSFFCAILFFLILAHFQISMQAKLFFIFPVIGILFSIAALKDLFGAKSELLDRFCNMTTSVSCTSVMQSNKWRIFEIINFSDLSIIFFCFQFLGLLTSFFINDSNSYFSIQKIILVCTMPLIMASLYYQKFVERKWCPICLIIIGIIILESQYIFFLLQPPFDLQIYPILVFGFILATIALLWFSAKKVLIEQRELKEFRIKGNRFMRNYKIFKNNLLASNKVENNDLQFEESLILGNPEASLKIILITSPFCSFCSEAHSMIEKILEKHSQKVCFDIRFNFNEKASTQKSKKIHQQLVSIFLKQGQEIFMNSLHDWFKTKDETKLNILESSILDDSKLNSILEKHFSWNQLNNINYTPAIIVNNHFFPTQYNRNDLMYFVSDLFEDEEFICDVKTINLIGART
ncbi:thioredoxin domain-containing protein [Flavobacterium daemonense]|uniref:thioredoxin domain-containing protein n=1 Tax=Flavobacterium daemonense TaxID=1393049 RepID=UPI001186582E|nr:thioredoxin domain-containing protein [Flavobacterium daemonense]KAF2329091.1 thioredoxin domain-containing protein [Flavobacterium daemonense]